MSSTSATPLPPLESPRASWRLLLRAPGAAANPRALILAALGLVAIRLGWAALDMVFPGCPWPAFVSGLDRGTGVIAGTGVIGDILAPFVAIFRPGLSGWSRIGACVASAWALVVWGVVGGAIVRLGVVRVARGGGLGLISAVRFSASRLTSLVAAPATTIAVAALIGLAGAAVGLLNRLPGRFGTATATALAFIPLLVGVVDAVILLGLALAWPLMIATVVAEDEDFFEAISRSYSYVNQRLALYATYLAVAAAIGAVGLVVVNVFVLATLGLADWSVGLSAPADVGFRFLRPESAVDATGRFWLGLVDLLASAWIYSYLWSVAAIVYLLLRRDVDGDDLHDIFEPGHEAEPFVPDEPTAAQEPVETS